MGNFFRVFGEWSEKCSIQYPQKHQYCDNLWLYTAINWENAWSHTLITSQDAMGLRSIWLNAVKNVCWHSLGAVHSQGSSCLPPHNGVGHSQANAGLLQSKFKLLLAHGCPGKPGVLSWLDQWHLLTYYHVNNISRVYKCFTGIYK